MKFDIRPIHQTLQIPIHSVAVIVFQLFASCKPMRIHTSLGLESHTNAHLVVEPSILFRTSIYDNVSLTIHFLFSIVSLSIAYLDTLSYPIHISNFTCTFIMNWMQT